METDAVIQVRDLVKRFGDQTVLDGVTLDVHEGETMVIMGGSGSGKSTLLRNRVSSMSPRLMVSEVDGFAKTVS